MNQKKIAEIANVSPSTVSKALSGSKEVSVELAEKIKSIAAKEGYFDEKLKRRLENIRKKNILIAVICPEIKGDYYSEIISVIKNEVEGRGGQVAVYINDLDSEKMNNIVKMITYKNETDGIISFSPIDNFIEIPTVVILKRIINSWFDVVSSESEKVMEDAVDYLIEMGHREIGFIGEKHTEGLEKNFRNAIIKKNLALNENFILKFNERYERTGYKAADKITSYTEKPTAVITAYDEIAMGFIHRLKESGLSVPEDISVMGINDIFYASFSQIPLTTMMVYKHQQAVRAVDLLYDKIINKTKEVKTVKTGHELIVRDTVKNLKGEIINDR